MLLDHQYGLPWHGSSVEQGWCWFIWIIKLPLILCSAHKSLAGGSNDKVGGGRLFWVIGSGGVNLSQGETQDGSVWSWADCSHWGPVGFLSCHRSLSFGLIITLWEIGVALISLWEGKLSQWTVVLESWDQPAVDMPVSLCFCPHTLLIYLIGLPGFWKGQSSVSCWLDQAGKDDLIWSVPLSSKFFQLISIDS